MYNFFLYGVLKFYTRSWFTWAAMWDDGQMSATKRDQLWMSVALRANFERSVGKLNLNQFSKF